MKITDELVDNIIEEHFNSYMSSYLVHCFKTPILL